MEIHIKLRQLREELSEKWKTLLGLGLTSAICISTYVSITAFAIVVFLFDEPGEHSVNKKL